MTLELEDQIQSIDEQQNDAGSAADRQCLVVGDFVVLECSMERSWNEQTHDCKGKHDTVHLGDVAIVDLRKD